MNESGGDNLESDASEAEPTQPPRAGVSRRHLLGGAGAAAAAAVGVGGYLAGRHNAAEGSAQAPARTYSIRGEHQPGILTPAQDSMFTAAFDVRDIDPRLVRKLFEDWSVAAQQMMAGELVGGAPLANKEAPPKDTGEAWGYPSSNLTITFGVGRSLFVSADGKDRFGLAAKMPEILGQGVPRFANEALRSGECDGDLLVQACADDSQVAIHAIRNLTRIAFGKATLRWSQIGYGRTSSTSKDQGTPRNLFGFKDGTNNIKSEDSADQLAEHLWVSPSDDQGSWMAGGTYYIARKIHMYLEVWDRLGLGDQEDSIGRDKMYGAPQSVLNPNAAAQEFTPIDYAAVGPGGKPLVPANSHVRIVAPETNSGRRMLRRGYNFTDGFDSLGRLNAGLFFVACVRDPRTNFYPILSKMAQTDALTEYLQHQASALFAIPPGVGDKETYLAQRLFS